MKMDLEDRSNMTTAQILGARIQLGIKAQKMTKTRFKELTGLNERTMRSYFSGDRNMDVARFKEIASVLDLPYDYLLGDTPFTKTGGHVFALLRDLGFELVDAEDPENPDRVFIKSEEKEIETTLSEILENIQKILRFTIWEQSSKQ